MPRSERMSARLIAIDDLMTTGFHRLVRKSICQYSQPKADFDRSEQWGHGKRDIHRETIICYADLCGIGRLVSDAVVHPCAHGV